MKKPATRPPKPLQRGQKLIRPTLAEEIEIARGIAADSDAREPSRHEIRKMRPFHEAMVMRQLGFRDRAAAEYLRSPEREKRYLDAAREVASRLNHPQIVVAALATIERSRLLFAESSGKRKSSIWRKL